MGAGGDVACAGVGELLRNSVSSGRRDPYRAAVKAYWLASAALWLGCSTAPAPTVYTPTPVGPSSPPPAVTSSLPSPTPVELPAVAVAVLREPDPEHVACRIEGVEWSADELRLDVEGPVFARADAAPARIVLPVTDHPSAAIVAMDDGAVLVHAVLRHDHVRLYQARPTALLGIVTPKGDTRLTWTQSGPGSAEISLDTAAVLASPRPFVARVACPELAITPGDYDARASITSRKRLAKRNLITDQVPLAASRLAQPVAALNRGEVELIETRGRKARIVVESHDYLVSGWVSTNDLVPPHRGLGPGGGGTGWGVRGVPSLPPERTRCPTDVSLFVELGTARVNVGLIHAQAGFAVLETAAAAGELREVELWDSRWLIVAAGARLVVERDELAGCARSAGPG